MFLYYSVFTNDLVDVFTTKLLIAVGSTTAVWIITTYLTKPESEEVLIQFYEKIQPEGRGWKKIAEKSNLQVDTKNEPNISKSILSVFIGCISIYSALFSIGNFIYGRILLGVLLALAFGIALLILNRIWSKFSSKKF